MSLLEEIIYKIRNCLKSRRDQIIFGLIPTFLLQLLNDISLQIIKYVSKILTTEFLTPDI